MKIKINDGQRDFDISIPTALLLNGITARVACSAAAKHAPEEMAKLSPHVLNGIFAELKRIRKKHGSWVLVEIESAKGERIEITV